MNYLQFSSFIFYAFSVFLAGIGVYTFLNKEDEPLINRSVYLGEILLLGSIFIIGQMLLLSLLGGYKGTFLWSIVVINYFPLIFQKVRKNIYSVFSKKGLLNISNIIFFLIIGTLVFRNLYYMFDVDSHSTYLYIQKLWLSAGTSLVGSLGHDVRIFLPHFNTVPSALGISLFGDETLFPQLVNVFWRIIVLFLVYGYTKYRFNNLTALAAVLLIAFNDHIFYSGVNQWVLINGALIALLFSCTYNFWQARQQNSNFRLLLAFIFLSQLMANKYQMAYIVIFLTVIGLALQKEKIKAFYSILLKPRWRIALVVAAGFSAVWYLKNFIVTGNPFFPVFAGSFGKFGWSGEHGWVFAKITGGRSFLTVIKYISYFFIWPGIKAAKIILLTIVFWPFILAWAFLKQNIDKEKIIEICFWLGISVFGIIGICIASHQDPRYFRYFIAIFSFSAVLSAHFIFRYCLGIKKSFIVGLLLFVFAFSGYRIVGQSAGNISNRPTIQDNLGVLTNKIHMADVIKKHFPMVPIIEKGLKDNPKKAEKTAWEFDQSVNTPLFLLPQKPLVSLWETSVIKWDSYKSKEQIVKDLQDYGIQWVAKIRDNKLVFVDIYDFAEEAVKFERFPGKIRFDYGFPAELKSVTY